MLAAPLKNHLGRTIGVIQVLNKRTGPEFTTEDEALMAALSTQAAVAIDNSRLFLSQIQKNKQLLDTTEQLQRKLRDLELLFELERATARAASLEELVEAVLTRVAGACDATGAALILIDDESDELVQYAVKDAPDARLQRIVAPAGGGLLEEAMSASRMMKVDELPPRDPGRHIEARYPFAVESALAAPMDGEDSTLGAIGVFTKQDHGVFSEEDLSLLRLVAANASTAIRLYQASAARQRSERLTTIGRLLSQVIHDFKTPMTVISGYVQLMANAGDLERRQEYAEEILKQFETVTSMQREVLAFARGESSIFARRVYLGKFFSDFRRQLEQEIGEKPIDLELKIERKSVARFDEVRIARAVQNLVRNAVEAMADHGGKLTLTARMEGPELVIAVSDTGPGVPPEIADRLFRSFVTARKEGGTGLGLAIAKRIAEEHGGRVEVESSSEGATFSLYLPQASKVAHVSRDRTVAVPPEAPSKST
jgi:signal transduction histidine kinase